MAQYTAEFLAAAQHGYEKTDLPMSELATELGIGITTLGALARKHGWAKRSLRKRGLRPEMQLLAEAQALAAGISSDSSIRHPEVRAKRASKGDGPDELQDRGPHPSRLAAARLAPQDDGVNAETALPLSESGPPPSRQELFGMMERILAQLITAESEAVANGIRSPQSARTLATLVATMRAIRQTEGDASEPTGPTDDDDDDELPRDLDAFRLALARRIDALFADEADPSSSEQDQDGEGPV